MRCLYTAAGLPTRRCSSSDGSIGRISNLLRPTKCSSPTWRASCGLSRPSRDVSRASGRSHGETGGVLSSCRIERDTTTTMTTVALQRRRRHTLNLVTSRHYHHTPRVATRRHPQQRRQSPSCFWLVMTSKEVQWVGLEVVSTIGASPTSLSSPFGVTSDDIAITLRDEAGGFVVVRRLELHGGGGFGNRQRRRRRLSFAVRAEGPVLPPPSTCRRGGGRSNSSRWRVIVVDEKSGCGKVIS